MITLQAIKVNKIQDRKYFLNSIRIAKNCTELDWSGFFSSYKGFKEGFFENLEQEEFHNNNVNVISKEFRDALYKDEVFISLNT